MHSGQEVDDSNGQLTEKLSLCTVWAVLVSSLEHAVRAFNLDVQEARFVGDGAIFACKLAAASLFSPGYCS